MQNHLKPSERKITPPGQLVINSLLTPPDSRAKPSERVKKILHLLKERKSGRFSLTPAWQTFKLHIDEYTELLDCLQTDEALWGFVEDKVR